MNLAVVRVRAGLLIVVCVCALTACGTLPSGRGWGEDATIRPGWERVRTSAVNAARDPWVWVPVVGAAVFQIDHWDRHTSDWARDNTPIFGSETSASDWSDYLLEAAVAADIATILATPSGTDAGEWWRNKGKGALVDVAAITSTNLVTGILKPTVGRTRPNGSKNSFPSGHASSSAVLTRLSSRNLQSIKMSCGVRTTLDVSLYTVTIATSWARVEAGAHFPSDVLFGMALGNFFGSFFNDAFMGLDPSKTLVVLDPTEGGAIVQVHHRF